MNTYLNIAGLGRASLSTCTAMVSMGLKTSLLITAVLVASGLIHLALLALWDASWSGPVSLRKPALFGISGGLTTWSIAWLVTQVKPQKYDSTVSNSFAICLLIEVALITVQFWRGVPSHFNHSTGMDAACELAMLALILVATVEIIYFSFRTLHLRTAEPSMALAIRAGMWLLALSCGLGILTTVVGGMNIANGRPNELWGKAGVLKFPHGVALHAVQYLPLVACIAKNWEVKKALRMVQAVLAAQVSFLIYAIWQTSQGRARFDFDVVGCLLLAITVFFGLIAFTVFVKSGAVTLFAKIVSRRR